MAATCQFSIHFQLLNDTSETCHAIDVDRLPKTRFRLELYDTHPKKAGGSEEHTSELQSRRNLVCRLLLEKKKKLIPIPFYHLL